MKILVVSQGESDSVTVARFTTTGAIEIGCVDSAIEVGEWDWAIAQIDEMDCAAAALAMVLIVALEKLPQEVDLMEALKASVEAAKAGKPAPERKTTSRRRKKAAGE